MYQPKPHIQHDTKAMIALMREHPFATVIVTTGNGIDAHHFPLLVHDQDGNLTLQGHIAKANPLWKMAEELPADKCDLDTVVIFHGPHTYITPSMYPTKHEHGKVVPTWNYIVVHAKGRMRFIHDGEWKLDLLKRLTQTHEAELPLPWAVDDAPEDFTQKMLPAIVGLEIDVTALDGKWKLSQNQPAENFAGVFQAMSDAEGHDAVALAWHMRAINSPPK